MGGGTFLGAWRQGTWGEGAEKARAAGKRIDLMTLCWRHVNKRGNDLRYQAFLLKDISV